MLFSAVGLLFLALLLNSSLTKEEDGFQMSSLASLMNLLSNTPSHLPRESNLVPGTAFLQTKGVSLVCQKLVVWIGVSVPGFLRNGFKDLCSAIKKKNRLASSCTASLPVFAQLGLKAIHFPTSFCTSTGEMHNCASNYRTCVFGVQLTTRKNPPPCLSNVRARF